MCNDEQTRKRLDPKLVDIAEKTEIIRFKKIGVYGYIPRSMSKNDSNGKTVRAMWVRTKTRSEENIDL